MCIFCLIWIGTIAVPDIIAFFKLKLVYIFQKRSFLLFVLKCLQIDVTIMYFISFDHCLLTTQLILHNIHVINEYVMTLFPYMERASNDMLMIHPGDVLVVDN